MLLQQRAFLLREFATLSIIAAFATRNAKYPVYALHCTPDQRDEVKRWFREELDRIHDLYAAQQISEEDHIQNICELIARANKKIGHFLNNGTLRFGVAQKLVNLYVKYLWSVGIADEPQHCPVDGLIRKAVGLQYDWTSNDSVSDYRNAIEAIARRSRPKGIAVWEITEFERLRK